MILPKDVRVNGVLNNFADHSRLEPGASVSAEGTL